MNVGLSFSSMYPPIFCKKKTTTTKPVAIFLHAVSVMVKLCRMMGSTYRAYFLYVPFPLALTLFEGCSSVERLKLKI